MAIIKSDTYSVKELLEKELRIPAYQRPYSWKREVALQLLYDLIREKGKGQNYLLGTVVLHQNGHDENEYHIVDGQHRMLTLQLLINLLTNQDQSYKHQNDTPLNQVHHALCQHIKHHLTNQEDRNKLADFIKKNCTLFTIITDDLDQAFRIFDSQNTRGKPLDPHDLLKAYHLRAIKDSSDKESVVRFWDSLTGNDESKRMLTILFSRYLYPIACWIRDQSAVEPFNKKHIHYFQGFRDKTLPAAEYHRHAGEYYNSQSGHAVFQLDTPIQDGVYFFKFIKFMLEELIRLSSEAFPDDSLSYYDKSNTLIGKSDKRHLRYVTELYLSALLYYVNRFGDKNIEQAKDVLIKWSYSLRIKHQRVIYNTINNHALGQGSINQYPLFKQIRNATDPLKLLFDIPISTPSLAENKNMLVKEREEILRNLFY